MNCLALNHIDFVKLLPKTCRNKRKFKKIISKATNNEIQAVSEICHNLLKGGIPCSLKNKQKLKKHVKDIRFISIKNTPIGKKKSLLTKKGSGFFLPLIPIAVAALTKLLTR